MMRKFMMNMKEDNKKKTTMNTERWTMTLIPSVAFNDCFQSVSVCVCVTFVFYEFEHSIESFLLHWITIYTNLECILFKIIKKIRCQLNNNFLIHQHFGTVFGLHEFILVCDLPKFAMKRKRTLLASFDYHQPMAQRKKKKVILFAWISTLIGGNEPRL